MKYPEISEDKKLAYLQEARDEAVELTEASRREAKEMYEYLRGNQLPWEVKNLLINRGQPIRWENIIQEIDTSLDGMKRMSKTEIEVINRHEDDVHRVAVLENLHRATLDSTSWWSEKQRADLDLRVAGLSVIESSLVLLDEYDKQGQRLKEVKRTHIPALECLIDMYSRRPDYSDARYFHYDRLYDVNMLKAVYGNNADKLSSNDRGMARVTRTWYRNGDEIRIATWQEDVILEDKVQPYAKTQGRFSVSIRKMHYTPHKEYYGIYRNMKPFQDDINNMMLRLKNMLGSYKMLIEDTAVDDVHTFADEYGLDNAVIAVKDGSLSQNRFKEISLTQNISQIMSLVQDARAKALQIMGINPELLGTSTMRQSGVALEIKQNAGLVGLQRIIEASANLDKDMFMIDTAIMEEHFKAEQVYSILGTNGKKQKFYVNEYERDDKGAVIFENGKPKQKSILSVGRYDFSLNQVPFNNGSTDAKMKSWAEMMKIIDPAKAAALIPSMLRDVGSPQAKETADILAKMDEQAAQAGNGQAEQLQMQEIQLAMQKMQAQIGEMQSKANLNNAKASEIAATTPTDATVPATKQV